MPGLNQKEGCRQPRGKGRAGGGAPRLTGGRRLPGAHEFLPPALGLEEQVADLPDRTVPPGRVETQWAAARTSGTASATATPRPTRWNRGRSTNSSPTAATWVGVRFKAARSSSRMATLSRTPS